MLNNLKSASLITLGILSGFIFTIFVSAAYLLGEIDVPFLIGTTIAFNFLMWILSPTITDFMLRIFYKMKFLSYDELQEQYPQVFEFLRGVCEQNKIKVPKIGIIDDDNPTAFTYGSLPANARMVFSKGLFTYLNQEEREAVFAHEVGHIVHYDFIIMTIASTLVQILYELYVIFSKTKKSGSGNRKGNIFAFIGLLSYVFYFLGTYVLLYLSRVREYYADEFSAKTTGNPNALSWALIRIAYGIVAKRDDEKSKRLMESTRALGVIDIKSAKGLGLVSELSDSPEIISKVMAFDFVSPWAFILELGSTHPLTGKRIERLNELARSLGKGEMFNIREIINSIAIDKPRLFSGFYMGVIIYFLPHIALIFGFLLGLLMGAGLNFAIVFLGIAFIIKALYKFPSSRGESATIRELMTDLYASPIRGRKVVLEGEIVGRGEAGAALSEDMMFHDKGGLVYLDYSSSLGIVGNLFFALKKIKELMGKPVIAEGWFFRGIGQMVSLARIDDSGKRIKSYPRLWAIIQGIILIIFGLIA